MTTRALHLRPDIASTVPRTAMIMAAGLGKRMRPLTASRPKPLVEVAGKALLDHVLDRLAAAGVARVVVNVHYLPDAVEAHLKRRTDFGNRAALILGLGFEGDIGEANVPRLGRAHGVHEVREHQPLTLSRR